MNGAGGLLKSLLLHPVTKRHTQRKIIKTSPRHLLQIIQDVDRYSEFLPLCSHSKIIRSQSPNLFDATLTVGLPPIFTEDFVSRVHVDPDNWIVDTKTIQSKLFDSLSSRWELTAVPDNDETVDVHFWMEMTVSDPIIVVALDQVLKEVAGRQVAAFEERCKVIPYIIEEEL